MLFRVDAGIVCVCVCVCVCVVCVCVCGVCVCVCVCVTPCYLLHLSPLLDHNATLIYF